MFCVASQKFLGGRGPAQVFWTPPLVASVFLKSLLQPWVHHQLMEQFNIFGNK